MSDPTKPTKSPRQLFAEHYAEQDRIAAEAAAQKAAADAPAQAALQAEAEQLKKVGAQPGLGTLFRPKDASKDSPAE